MTYSKLATVLRRAFGFVSAAKNPVTGRIGNLLDTDGSAIKLANVGQDLAPMGFPLVFSPRVASTAAPFQGTKTDVTRTTPDGKTLNGVKLTANNNVTNTTMEFTFTATKLASGLVGYLIYIPSMVTANKQLDITFYIGDSTLSNNFNKNVTVYQPGWYYICPGKSTDLQSVRWTSSGGTAAFGSTFDFVKTKIRINCLVGETPSVEVYGIFEGPKPAVSKVAFVLDDGWLSQYTVAAPIFERYRAPMTCAIIAGLVDLSPNNNPLYMSVEQCLDLKNRGHQIAIHGPIGGTGNLTKYSGDPDPQASVYNDVMFTKNLVVNNNLHSDGSERCYVYPQGAFQFSNGDTKIIDALKQAGMVGARLTPNAGNSLDPMRPVFGYDPFSTIQCAGHIYSATGEAGEPTNIANIITRINDAAASGRDICIMLHKVLTTVPTDTTGGTEIQDVNLVKLLEAVARNQLAGTQRFAKLSDILFSHAGMPLNRSAF